MSYLILSYLTVSNPARPQVADSGTAPGCRSYVITPIGPLAIAVEDEDEQAGGASVVLKYLSGESRCRNSLYLYCSAGSPVG